MSYSFDAIKASFVPGRILSLGLSYMYFFQSASVVVFYWLSLIALDILKTHFFYRASMAVAAVPNSDLTCSFSSIRARFEALGPGPPPLPSTYFTSSPAPLACYSVLLRLR